MGEGIRDRDKNHMTEIHRDTLSFLERRRTASTKKAIIKKQHYNSVFDFKQLVSSRIIIIVHSSFIILIIKSSVWTFNFSSESVKVHHHQRSKRLQFSNRSNVQIAIKNSFQTIQSVHVHHLGDILTNSSP